MKTIINSCKRTDWFKASESLLTCLMFLMLPSCQKDELNQDYIADISPLALSKKTTAAVGKVKDADGNWYKTVKIGKQWWMAENLRLKVENGSWEYNGMYGQELHVTYRGFYVKLNLTLSFCWRNFI